MTARILNHPAQPGHSRAAGGGDRVFGMLSAISVWLLDSRSRVTPGAGSFAILQIRFSANQFHNAVAYGRRKRG